MRKKKKPISIGIIFVALGIGILAMCVFPSKWMVVFVAAALVAAGILLLKC